MVFSSLRVKHLLVYILVKLTLSPVRNYETRTKKALAYYTDGFSMVQQLLYDCASNIFVGKFGSQTGLRMGSKENGLKRNQ